jgi:hypothetical protein
LLPEDSNCPISSGGIIPILDVPLQIRYILDASPIEPLYSFFLGSLATTIKRSPTLVSSKEIGEIEARSKNIKTE